LLGSDLMDANVLADVPSETLTHDEPPFAQ
jgi:hypothetical protein